MSLPFCRKDKDKPSVAGLTAYSEARLPPELRQQIWRYALHEPLRVVMLGAHFIYGRRVGSNAIPIGGEFYYSSEPYRQEEGFKAIGSSEQTVWPSKSQEVIKALSLACQESRYEVMRMYPDIIQLFSCSGSRLGRRCSLKGDVFLLEIGLTIGINSPSEAGFFNWPPSCVGNIHEFWKYIQELDFLDGLRGEWPLYEDQQTSLPPSGKFSAARNDEFCQTLKAMRKMAFLVAAANHFYPEARPPRAEARMWPIDHMMPWLPNLEIVYFLPPDARIGDDKHITAVPFRLDDVWHPRSGRSRNWLNPQCYIEMFTQKVRGICRYTDNLTAWTTPAVDIEKLLDEELAAEGGLGRVVSGDPL